MGSMPSSSELPRESLDSAILGLLMEAIPDRIYFKDTQSRFVRTNMAQARFLGAGSPGEMVGKSDSDYFSPAHAAAAFADEQEIMRTGEPQIGRVDRITRQDGTVTWGSTTKMPWRDAQGRIIGTFGLTRDVTAAKEAEERLNEERKLLRTIIDHLPSRIFVKDTEGRFLVDNQAHLDEMGLKTQEQATGHTVMDFYPGERGVQATADDRQVLSGGPPIVNAEKSNFGAGGQARWSLTTKVPFHDIQGTIAGLVGISHDITERKRTEEELRRRTGQMEEDLAMARQVQESFLPRVYPVFPAGAEEAASTLRFAHRYVPATSLGGDFCDIMPLSESQCGVLVCDVMGHGVRAGLLTALIRGVVREIDAGAVRPGHVLGEINRALTPILAQLGQPLFATLFFGVIDTAVGTLTVGNAGHPPPLIRRRDGGRVESVRLADPEPAAGLVDAFAYSESVFAFRTGDLLVAYTDGLFEAANEADVQFGEERVSAFVAKAGARPIDQLIDGLLEEVRSFCGHREFEDDVCILAVQRSP